MRHSRRNKSYPSVHTWNYVTPGESRTDSAGYEIPAVLTEIEGYCMLNIGFSQCKNRYNFEMKPDGTFKRQKNIRYDPNLKPEPFPEGCPQKIRSVCIRCRHFAWCEPDTEI